MKLYENDRVRARDRACRLISHYADQYWKYLEKFEKTEDTINIFMAMYYEDCIKRIARDWNMEVDYATRFVRIRWDKD